MEKSILSKKISEKAALFDYPIASYLLLFFCFITNMAQSYQLLSSINTDAVFVTFLCALVFAVNMTVIPMYVGILLKKMRQGAEVDPSDKFLIGCLVIAFIITTAAHISLHIAFRTVTFPMTVDITKIYTYASWTYIAVLAIIPILTAIVSFCVAYAMVNSGSMRQNPDK